MGPVRAEVMAGVMLCCAESPGPESCPAANGEQVLLTWRAVYSFIDPAFYAVASRIRKTDSICDLNAVRLGAGKLDEGCNCLCPPHAMHTLTRACVSVCAHASHHDECWGSCRPYNSIGWATSPW